MTAITVSVKTGEYEVMQDVFCAIILKGGADINEKKSNYPDLNIYVAWHAFRM